MAFVFSEEEKRAAIDIIAQGEQAIFEMSISVRPTRLDYNSPLIVPKINDNKQQFDFGDNI